MTTVVAVTNTSGVSCTLLGYPSLSMLDGSGGPMSLDVSLAGVVEGGSVQPILLAHRQGATFSVSYTLVRSAGEEFCPQGAALLLTLPGSNDPLRVQMSLTPCNHGAVLVSAFKRGLPS